MIPGLRSLSFGRLMALINWQQKALPDCKRCRLSQLLSLMHCSYLYIVYVNENVSAMLLNYFFVPPLGVNKTMFLGA